VPKPINGQVNFSVTKGFAGLGGDQPVSFSVELPKNTFYAGEKIPIRVNIDNSKCAKEIVKVKAKLTLFCIYKLREQLTVGLSMVDTDYKMVLD
jgi:hypothetical protein